MSLSSVPLLREFKLSQFIQNKIDMLKQTENLNIW